MKDLIRTRWAAVGAAVAITLGAGGVSLTQAAISSGEKPVTVTVDTTRILDTRTGVGLGGGKFVDSTPQDLQVTGNVPIVPSGTATVVPTGAIGVLVNVTVVAPDSKGFLSLRAGGAAGAPSTSTVNFEAGITSPNAATVDLSGDGKLQIWLETDNDGGTAHVLLDIVGYTVDHNHDDRYYQKGETYSKSEVDSAVATKDNSDASGVFDDGDSLANTGADKVVASVVVDTPTRGFITVNASLSAFGFAAEADIRCSITSATALDTNNFVRADVPANKWQVLALTRLWTISFAPVSGETTLNLVCDADAANLVDNINMTAVFTPDPDAQFIFVPFP